MRYAAAVSGQWVVAADLHGRPDRYRALWSAVEDRRPTCVLLGGDLLPPGPVSAAVRFVNGELAPALESLRARLGTAAPTVGLVLGNDDPSAAEPVLRAGEEAGLWCYLHRRWIEVGGIPVGGYNCVPPTPFALKDWERYDVSRYVDPGCVSPEEGRRTTVANADDVRYGTIAADLADLVAGVSPEHAVLLCHAPPHGTALDRAALDGAVVDHVPLDPHVGSIAVRRLIESWQPRLTLHGHVHESARLTGAWRERIGRTVCVSAAHDGPETALVVLDPERPEAAQRLLLG